MWNCPDVLICSLYFISANFQLNFFLVVSKEIIWTASSQPQKYKSGNVSYYNDGHNIFRECLILYQFFFSPQIKWSVIIRNKQSSLKLS